MPTVGKSLVSALRKMKANSGPSRMCFCRVRLRADFPTNLLPAVICPLCLEINVGNSTISLIFDRRYLEEQKHTITASRSIVYPLHRTPSHALTSSAPAAKMSCATPRPPVIQTLKTLIYLDPMSFKIMMNDLRSRGYCSSPSSNHTNLSTWMSNEIKYLPSRHFDN